MAEAEPQLKGTEGRVTGGSVLRTGAAHLILMAAAAAFLMPLLWMLVTSLKPLKQTMTIPPTWVPKATYAKLDGNEVIVEKEKKIAEDSVIVIPQAGGAKGQRKLLESSQIKEGRALIRVARGGREVLEPDPVPVEILKPVPKGCWLVKEWAPDFSSEREKTKSELRWDCVPESDLREEPHAFLANYPSMLARMRETGAEHTWYSTGFVKYLINTLWVCLLSVFGVVASCTLVAYAFAFLEFPGRNWLFALTLAVMMIPFPATMVPRFDVFRELGWVGTFKPLWVPMWFGAAFYIFLLRQFFLGLPKDLLDAARIDGCSELEILWHVVVPLARPALAMVALFQFLGSWKDFMGPLLYLQDRSQFTLSLGLQAFQSQQGGTPWHLSMAAGMMFSLPLLILFLIARKSFMQGIAMTGIKG
ncbi:MAG TPA: carbohydrate ABC transporter permease [Planctomycetota bacterium]|nr:carbohydrate ABC transporter permease [Planctomycetota bacterium]